MKAFITFAAVAAQTQTGFYKLPVTRQDWVFFTQQDSGCCFITADSATTALQNGACTYQCISKQNSLFTQRLHEKPGIL